MISQVVSYRHAKMIGTRIVATGQPIRVSHSTVGVDAMDALHASMAADGLVLVGRADYRYYAARSDHRNSATIDDIVREYTIIQLTF